MNKPFIVCHMMMSVDGRIDCGMTAQLPGVDDYYASLEACQAPTRVSGRVTAMLEMADKDAVFEAHGEAIAEEAFSKKEDAVAYEVIMDTKGTLCWDHWEREKPLIIVTGEQVKTDYLAYLDGLGISWIACGETRIDLVRAAEILADEFSVTRMAVVGGGAINAGFLDAGLLDAVSILLAPGIDGRGGMASTFDGLPMDRTPFALKLESVEAHESGAVSLYYQVEK